MRPVRGRGRKARRGLSQEGLEEAVEDGASCSCRPRSLNPGLVSFLLWSLATDAARVDHADDHCRVRT
jgi:hypothetical protein